jgi:hypothetical protein
MSLGQLHELLMTYTAKKKVVDDDKDTSTDFVTGDLSSGYASPSKKKRKVMDLIKTPKDSRPKSKKCSQFSTAGKVYLMIKMKKIRVNQFSKQDKSRVQRVVLHYDMMCTNDEHQLLVNSDVDDNKKLDVLDKVSSS